MNLPKETELSLKKSSILVGAMIAKLKAQLAQRGGDLLRERCESCFKDEIITRWLKAESKKWDTLIVVEKDKLFAEMDERIT